MPSSTSSDEGEIRDEQAEKANTSQSSSDGRAIDRPDRNRRRASSSPSPERKEDDARASRLRDQRSRSPYSERLVHSRKRQYYDDYDARDHDDPRRFRVHYEDSVPRSRRRSRGSYQDVDRERPSPKSLSYDEQGPPDKRRRTRSPRHGGRQERDGREYTRKDSRHQNYYTNDPPIQGLGIYDSRVARHESVSNRGQAPLPTDRARREAKTSEGLLLQHSDQSRVEDSEIPGDNRQDLAGSLETEPVDEAALIEERRRRREAIKAKYRSSATPLLVQALHLSDKSGLFAPGNASQDEGSRSTRSTSPASVVSTPLDSQQPASPSTFAVANDEELANQNGESSRGLEDDGPSAADYDPTVDMREDRQRDDQRHNEEVESVSHDELKPTIEQDVLLPVAVPAVQKKKAEDEFDMFAEEDDDIFVDKTDTQPKAGSTTPKTAKAVPIPTAKELDIGMLDNWDDTEGYYKVILGELLNGRYHVQTNLGKGMFSGVVQAMDTASKKLVAIKIIRNNETMRKAGAKEIDILYKINQADPDDRKHMIRLQRSFDHKGHLCMVFENLSINLREVLKKFGRDVGINLRAVRAYAHQMLLGLSLLKKCSILHADLKPDNILARNNLKICDLGSASDASENEITPYLVSRFYRAPEIILGMPYDFAIDVWSVGCTLYELYTGKILFTGRTNNQMLRSIMDCRGKFTTKMLKKAQFAHVHFDELANFRSIEQDKLTGKDTIKTLNFSRPSRDLRTRLTSASKGLTEPEAKELASFVDLLDKCLALNPEKRCTPAEALKHPFIMKVGSK